MTDSVTTKLVQRKNGKYKEIVQFLEQDILFIFVKITVRLVKRGDVFGMKYLTLFCVFSSTFSTRNLACRKL